MQDGRVEAGPAREGRVGVQRVAVAVEPVEQGLVGPGVVADGVVGFPVGQLPGAGRAPVAAPAALAGDEQAGPAGPHGVAVVVGGVDLQHHQRGLALVVDGGHPVAGCRRTLGRQLLVELDVLVAVEQAGPVVVAVVGSAGAADHHRLGGQGPLGHPGRILGGELQLGAGWVGSAGPHAQGIKQALVGAPAHLCGIADRADRIGINGHPPNLPPAHPDSRSRVGGSLGRGQSAVVSAPASRACGPR